MNSDYDVIDGLRGIAIILVVACHIFSYRQDSSNLIRLIGGTIAAGRCGVIVFFCLSGFLISLPFWKRKLQGQKHITPPGYAARRFWKIYPAFALSIIVCFPIFLIASEESKVISSSLYWLFGLPLFYPIENVVNGVMWTLIVEVHFYASLPILFFLTRKASFKITLIILFAALLIIPTVYKWWCISRGTGPSLSPILDTKFPSQLSGFAFGVLIAGLEGTGQLRRSLARLGPLGIGMIASSMILSSVFDLYYENAGLREALYLIQMLAAALLLLLISDPDYPTTRLLSMPTLRWFGIISYEWYLLHQPFHYLYCYCFGSPNGHIFRWLMMIIITSATSLMTASAIYLMFSKPILQWGRCRAKSRASATSPNKVSLENEDAL